jgi:hypothetical protein
MPEPIMGVPREGVVFRPLSPTHHRDLTIAWRADNPSKPLKNYIQIVKDLARSTCALAEAESHNNDAFLKSNATFIDRAVKEHQAADVQKQRRNWDRISSLSHLFGLLRPVFEPGIRNCVGTGQ